MSEVNRPSASDEARAAQVAADQKKVKQQDPKMGMQGAQAKGYGDTSKKVKSSFDDALTKATESGLPLIKEESKFDSKVREIHRDQEGSSDSDKEDHKKQKTKGEGGPKTRHTKEGQHERVLAKQDSGEGRQDSSSGQREGKGGQPGSGFGQKTTTTEQFLKDLGKDPVVPASTAELAKGAVKVPTPVVAAEAPRALPKAVLDQIVQYVRIGMNKDLNKEIQIDFHDNFFNGLRLKVVSNGKEISVEFLAPNRAVAECFRQERENIALVLGEKGIDVRSIQVTQA